MFRRLLLAFVVAAVVSVCYCEESSKNLSEALHVRRIVELWRDSEGEFVKSQVSDFLNKYPGSEFSEGLIALLGDVYFGEHDYEAALGEYDKVRDGDLCNKVLVNKLYCLYTLGRLEEVVAAVDSMLEDSTLEDLVERDPRIIVYYTDAKFHLLEVSKAEEEEFCSVLEPYYRALMNTLYRENAMLSLAEVYRLCGDDQKAVDLYLMLADENEDIKELVLYQAGIMLINLDKERALEILSQVMDIKGKESSSAAVKWAVTIFKEQRFEELLSKALLLEELFPENQQMLLNNMLGRASLSLGKYQQAEDFLSFFLEEKGVSPDLRKKALLNLSIAAYYLEHTELLNDVNDVFMEAFPKDQSIARVLFLRALAYEDLGDDERAWKDLNYVVDNFPSFQGIEEVVFQRDIVAYRLSHWQESRNGFASFIVSYPHSDHLNSAYKYLLNSSIRSFENTESNDDVSLLRKQLIGDMKVVLGVEGVLSTNVKKQCELQLATLLYEDEDYSTCLEVLRSYLKQYPQDQSLYRVHFMMALCYQQQVNLPSFAFHAEQVLSLYPSVPEAAQLRLNLFNLYLQFANGVDDIGDSAVLSEKKRDKYLKLAANHLYHAIVISNDPIDSKSLLWLGDYYLGLVERNISPYEDNVLRDVRQSELAERGIRVLEKILGLSRFDDVVVISEDQLFLESEVIKMARMLKYLGNYDRQVRVLEGLRNQYDSHPLWQWQHKDEALLMLANAYELSGDYVKAIPLYKYIVDNTKYQDSFLYNKAQLQLARLQFKELYSSGNVMQRQRYGQVLGMLKRLQIKKSLKQEPIHLEAALEYADIMASLEPQEKRMDVLLQLLQNAKVDFTDKSGIDAKDYHEMRKRMPDKDNIYRAYIMLLDARIAMLKAGEAERQGRLREAENYHDIAQTIFSALIDGNFAVSGYVVDQAKKGLHNLGVNLLPREGNEESKR